MGRLQANFNLSKNNKISIKKQNTGGKRLVASPRQPTISNITSGSGSSGGGIGGGGI